MGVQGQCTKKPKVLLTIFGFGKDFGPYRVCEVAKGPKNCQLKKLTFHGFRKRQYILEKLPTRFSTIGPNKGYYLDIGNTQKFYAPKTKFRKIIFWASNFFLTLVLKSFNSNSSSFGKTVKPPINYLSRLLAQMAALGISRFLGPK